MNNYIILEINIENIIVIKELTTDQQLQTVIIH